MGLWKTGATLFSPIFIVKSMIYRTLENGLCLCKPKFLEAMLK